MKLTVIGYWGAYPEAGEATSGYLIEEDDYRILVDCGSGVLSRLQQYLPLMKLDAVVLSHYHADHIADLRSLQYATMIQSQLDNRSTVLPVYGHDQDKDAFQRLTYQDYCQGIPIRHQQTLTIGPFKLRFISTTHPVYCLAMDISTDNSRMIYTADTEWNEDLLSFAPGSDLVISEASIYRAQKGKVQGHLTGEEAGQLAARLETQSLLLTHLPHFGQHEELVKEAGQHFKGPIDLAYEGKTYIL
ncbi:MBL fold metallo-hydrolase [Caldalkalibacillus salinus]|uniref:MBL fold metallo-hydrolase n=1 Tax=Caldalkalibacillus salinus TaxID=2803787 RepID=UPI001923E453|nr:MBL fold metallo-hydrolase [Caldalkalibacillus salinus]